MPTEAPNIKEILRQIEEEVSELMNLISSLDEKEINAVPFENSWTAAQLFRHVTKSTNGIAKAMNTEAKLAERDIAQRIPELKKAFLDLSTKFKAPGVIVPEEGPHEKKTTVEKLNRSFERLKESANNANLSELVGGLPFGEVTKLEMLHFVLYHTQRHLHQLKKIISHIK